MEELQKILQETVCRGFVQIILSNTRDESRGFKVKVRPVRIKEELLYQETMYRGTQVFHENLTREELVVRLEEYLKTLFKQGEIQTGTDNITILVSKKGKMTIRRRKKNVPDVPGGENGTSRAEGTLEDKVQTAEGNNVLQHNRTKQYILMEGTPVDFLVGLGVQTPDGRITKNRYDKFRQINRYLELIEDVLEELPSDRTIRIIDFGCGKSYLTFAMYYYLHELQQRDIEVTGLDLKTDVIAHCNQLAEKLHYSHLHFEHGDISSYEGADTVDMVVTLHACDTATDYALEKAVKWGAGVIMAVPCCQHEINKQIKNEVLKPVLKYGLIKERISALVTDAVRANILEQQGYDTQILEFIDMEHTPKNILIRAVKRKGMHPRKKNCSVEELTDFLQISPTLERLLK